MKTTRKGKIAEHKFIASFLEKGYRVYLPAEEDDPIDLIFEKDGNFVRVQVKSIIPRKGVLELKNRLTNATQHKSAWYDGKIDYFAVYNPKSEKGYLVPKAIVGRNSFSLRLLPTKNKQSVGIHWAKNYLFFSK